MKGENETKIFVHVSENKEKPYLLERERNKRLKKVFLRALKDIIFFFFISITGVQNIFRVPSLNKLIRESGFKIIENSFVNH